MPLQPRARRRRRSPQPTGRHSERRQTTRQQPIKRWPFRGRARHRSLISAAGNLIYHLVIDLLFTALRLHNPTIIITCTCTLTLQTLIACRINVAPSISRATYINIFFKHSIIIAYSIFALIETMIID
jgi:hypothetical protein